MDETAPPVANQLEDLHWLIGAWLGDINGQPVEEHWFPERGGQMIMCFRWMTDGKPHIYEFGILGRWDGEVQMRLRHIRSTGASIEHQEITTTFRLIDVQDQTASFEEVGSSPPLRLLYHRSNDFLKVWFESDSGLIPVQGVFVYVLLDK
ncbi:MAG: hypothetical protein KF812_04155 [Fimbriimonadaceae bacterium]|nr:hypothetical protein [Fimbriimonadaceae bacterium]